MNRMIAYVGDVPESFLTIVAQRERVVPSVEVLVSNASERHLGYSGLGFVAEYENKHRGRNSRHLPK